MSFTPEMLNSWMAEALELAKEAEIEDEVPVGALLVHESKIIGRGMNLRETNNRTVAHAEVSALEDYSNRTGQWRVPVGTTLVVTVEPCLMCTGALLWARVSDIVYGCKDTRNAGLLRVSPLIEQGVYDHRFQSVTGGIRSEECSSLMSNYFKKKR